MKYRLLSLLPFVAFAVMLADWSNLQAADSIKIGEYNSLTGKESGFGVNAHQGIILAFEMVNAQGGVLGRQLELLSEDTGSLPGHSAAAVQKLIDRKVAAILGEVTSDRSLEGAPVCQAAKVPMLAPTSTNPKVTQVGNYIFRGCFIDSFQGSVMAKLAIEKLKAKRIALLFSANTAYGVDLAKYFREGIQAGGATMVAETEYLEGAQDFKTQLATLKAAQPDVIFAPGYYAEGALIMKQARELGITAPFLGGDGWEDEVFTKVGGKAVEGVRVSSHFSLHDPSPRVRAFVAAYRKRWGIDATVGASLGYDAAMMLADAIKRARSIDHEAIRDALAATKNFEAVTGTINVNENRDVSKSVVILAVKEGRFQFVERIAP